MSSGISIPIRPSSNISRRRSLLNFPASSISRTYGPMRSRANLRTTSRNMDSSSLSTVSGEAVTGKASVAVIYLQFTLVGRAPYWSWDLGGSSGTNRSGNSRTRSSVVTGSGFGGSTGSGAAASTTGGGGGSTCSATGAGAASAAVRGTSHSQQSLHRRHRMQRWFEQVSLVQYTQMSVEDSLQ